MNETVSYADFGYRNQKKNKLFIQWTKRNLIKIWISIAYSSSGAICCYDVTIHHKSTKSTNHSYEILYEMIFRASLNYFNCVLNDNKYPFKWFPYLLAHSKWKQHNKMQTKRWFNTHGYMDISFPYSVIGFLFSFIYFFFIFAFSSFATINRKKKREENKNNYPNAINLNKSE